MAIPLKVTLQHNMADNTTRIMGTPEQEEIRATEHDVKNAVVRMLAEQYVKEYGHKILDSISPNIIADEVKKAIARKVYSEESNGR